MKDVEAVLLRIPGVTEARVFAKVLMRCEFPMSPDTMAALQLVQAQVEYETGWKVEMTVSAGKEPEPKHQCPKYIVCKPCDLERCTAVLDATERKRLSLTHGISGQDIANWEKARKAVGDKALALFERGL